MSQPAAPDLSRLPLFADLSPEALQRLQACLIPREVLADEELIKFGSRGDWLAIVERGLVCLEGANGRLQSVGAGGIFGEAMLRYGVPSAFSARTLAPTTLWMLRRADWLALRQNPLAQSQEDAPEAASPIAAHSRIVSFLSKTPIRYRSPLRLLFLASLALALLIASPWLTAAGGGWLALRLLDARRPQEAAAVLRLALMAQPDSATLHDTYGYLLFRQGDLEAARAEFEQALRLEPELASALNNLGVTLLAAGHPDRALAYLEQASALDPGDATLQANLGDAHLAGGDREAAMAAYQRAFALDPALWSVRSRWAILALQRGDLQTARQALQEVILSRPQDAQAQLGLGVIAWREGRLEAAIEHLQSARQADPGDPVARLYLGLALQAADQPEKAVLEFEQALALSQELAVQNLAREHLLTLYQAVYAPKPAPGASMEGGEGLPTP
jgi:Flp pilus assembly protein TadD